MPHERGLEEMVEFAENPELRCPCVLLLDTSRSMQGDRIAALNKGLETLRDSLVRNSLTAGRIEIAIITFDDVVRTVQDFVTADRFQPPVLRASGRTHMGEAIELALDLVDIRKRKYRRNGISYYRPWVLLITDGKPEGEADDVVKRAANRVRADEQAKRAIVFAVGVAGADMDRLSQMVVRPPLELDGLNFESLFVWLSSSMQSISQSQPGDSVTLPRLTWVKPLSEFLRKHGDLIVTITRLGARIAGVPI